MWEQVQHGEAQLLAKSCGLAKVVWIKTFGTNVEPPWDLWGRIFQWLGSASSNLGMQGSASSNLGMQGSACKSGKPWHIYWLPAEEMRILPSKGAEVGPKHINGGYCYPCRPDTILIYRYEEATRVLLHELLHAACLDPHGAALPYKEANTETWAELFLVAVCSQGDKKKAEELWSHQSQWIADQNAVLRKVYHVKSPDDYTWRYTLGREVVLDTLHILLPRGRLTHQISCRLTSPVLCM